MATDQPTLSWASQMSGRAALAKMPLFLSVDPASATAQSWLPDGHFRPSLASPFGYCNWPSICEDQHEEFQSCQHQQRARVALLDLLQWQMQSSPWHHGVVVGMPFPQSGDLHGLQSPCHDEPPQPIVQHVTNHWIHRQYINMFLLVIIGYNYMRILSTHFIHL